MTIRRGGRALTLVALATVLVACTGSEDSAAPSEPPAATIPQARTSETAAAPSGPAASPTPERVLEDRFYQDADGNLVPDFVEMELGFDPAVDDCLVGDCPEARPFVDPEGVPRVEENTLLILDSSGSMAGDDGSGTIKIDAARSALERLVIGTPDTTNLGLLVYGHRGNNEDSGRAESCAGIEVFAPLGELTAASVPGVLDRFQPTGWTPIGASLDRAGEVFAGTEGARNRVILVTDGIETCDGDPVGAARRLANSGVTVTVDVVGFDVETQGDRRALEAIAEASGGTYTDAADAGQLDAYVDELLRAREDARSAWLCLRGAVDQAGACSNFFLTEAGAVVARERDSIADSSSPQWQELNHIWRNIADSNVERYEQLRAEYDPILAELEAAYRAADERYSRRYGRPVSVAPSIDCPLLDQIALLREPAVGPSVG